jgi:hypothetical protein
MDLDHLINTFIVTLPATIAAVGALLASLRNAQKIDTSNKKIDANTVITVAAKKEVTAQAETAKTAAESAAVKVAEVATAINGRMDERVQAAKAEGYIDGRKAHEEQAAKIAANTDRIEKFDGRLQGIEKKLDLIAKGGL